jgi:hypothetical protein
VKTTKSIVNVKLEGANNLESEFTTLERRTKRGTTRSPEHNNIEHKTQKLVETQEFLRLGQGTIAKQVSTRGVSNCGLAIYIKKYLLKAKRRIMKIQIFHL